jgi:ribonuclease E
MVRQLRLRDIGGIIVIDFIDMVLETNRELVLRRLVECLGRDRTRHQVAEVTSLGLVQMTRKRIGTGLLEAFSHVCEQCQGRGILVEGEPADPKRHDDQHDHHGQGASRGSRRSSNRRRGKRGSDGHDHPDEASTDRQPEATDGATESAPQQPTADARAEPATPAVADAPSDGAGEGTPPPARGRRRRRASRPTGAPDVVGASPAD